MRIGMIPENPLEWFLCKINAIPFPAEDTLVALLQTRAVMAGSQLGIFDTLATNSYTLSKLAEKVACQETELGTLLSSLVHCGYIRAKAGKYELSPRARKWLTPGTPESINSFIDFNYDNLRRLDNLEKVLKTGKAMDIHSQLHDIEEWRRYLFGLHDLAKLAVKEMMIRCSFRTPPSALLDIGGGHGGYSAAYCRRFPDLKAIIFDLPDAIKIGTEIVNEYYPDVSERISFVQGNIEKDSIGKGYDLVFLMNVIHHLQPGHIPGVLTRIFEGMKPNGTLVIIDQFKETGKSGSYLASLAELLFLVMSSGKTYGLSEVNGWLEEAGFTTIKVFNLKVGPGTSVLTTIRK